MEHIYSFENFQTKIDEGLITTYKIDKTIKDISKLISSYNIDFKINNLENFFELELYSVNKIPNFEKIFDIILYSIYNQYGWFPSKSKLIGIFGNSREYKFNKNNILYNLKNLQDVIITFEAKFDEIINDIPEKLYHLSILHYSKDIEQKGLICKGKSKLTRHDYDGRIYLCKTIEDCKHLIPKMKFFYEEEKYDIIKNPNNPKGKYNKNTKWVIYEIDTKLAGINKLYQDPNYLNGYYYLNNINKNSIKLIEQEM
jgi:hypothetical protein